MAERSFKKEVEKLRLGEGEIFEGEGILAVTKALLQSGVAYVGGYQGSPISHLMDVFSDADPLLRESLEIYAQKAPESWLRFRSQSHLGALLLSQQHFAEAEPLLLQGY